MRSSGGSITRCAARRTDPLTEALSLTESEGRVTGALLRRGGALPSAPGRRARDRRLLRTPELRQRLLPAGRVRLAGGRKRDRRWHCARRARRRSLGASTTATASGRRCRCVAAATARSPSFPISCSIAASRASSPSTPRGAASSTRRRDYHLFAEAMIAALAEVPPRTCFLICDDASSRSMGWAWSGPADEPARAPSPTAT